MSGLGEGQVLRDDSDVGAEGVLILSEGFEHEDAAGDVNADAIALPVFWVDLLAGEAEMAALIDVAEHAVAKVDGMEDGSFERAEPVVGLFDGDGARHLVSDTFLVGGGAEFRFGLEGETGAAVDFADGRENVGGGKHLQ